MKRWVLLTGLPKPIDDFIASTGFENTSSHQAIGVDELFAESVVFQHVEKYFHQWTSTIVHQVREGISIIAEGLVNVEKDYVEFSIVPLEGFAIVAWPYWEVMIYSPAINLMFNPAIPFSSVNLS